MSLIAFCGSYIAHISPDEEPSGTRYFPTASVSPQSFKGKKAVPSMEALFRLNRA